MIAALALPVAAAAQTPQPSTTPGSATLLAPGRAPPLELRRAEPPGGMVLREGIVPPGSAAVSAGPTNATPFSATPSGTLPFNGYAPQGRSDLAIDVLTTPNVGK
jgi:hypothetical protein